MLSNGSHKTTTSAEVAAAVEAVVSGWSKTA